jgi:hypothetical protein
MRLAFLSVGLAALVPFPVWAADPPADPAPKPAPKLSVSVEGDIDAKLAPVAGKLTEVFFESYPKLLDRFDDPKKPAPRRIRIVFRKGMKVPAYCGGDTVTVSVEWLTRHPEDVALMTHELTHAVQAYPRNDLGWVTEGIADYARFKYGPKEQPGWELPKRLTARDKYTDSYRTTARFFAWLDDAHPGTVDKIHRAMQAGKFSVEDFKEFTGKTVDELWAGCVKATAAK